MSFIDSDVLHPTQEPVSRRSVGRAALGALAALGLVCMSDWQQPVLLADGPAQVDTDGDGLPDAQEYALGTSPLLADTDFDGLSDGEEVALGTSPFNFNSLPPALPNVSVGLTARGEGGKLRLVITLYAQDGNFADKTLEMSIYSQGRYGVVPLSRLLPLADVSEVTSANGASLLIFDVGLPPVMVESLGAVTWIAKAGILGSSEVVSAAKADLSWKDGLILWRRSGHLLPPSITFSASSTSLPTGSVHDPIPPGGDGGVPSSWEPGQVCIQSSSVVGSNGPFQVREVVEASCSSGWDSYCDQGCSGTVGDQFETVDTFAILGG